MGGAEADAVAAVLATNRRASRACGQPLGNRCSTSRAPTLAPPHAGPLHRDLPAAQDDLAGYGPAREAARSG